MSERLTHNNTLLVFQDLGILEYKQALSLQTMVRNQKTQNPDHPDHLFFVEHPPVFTLGKRGGLENLMVTKQFLLEQNVDLVQTERGGNITFHGPGQAVLYPIIDLERARIGVADFVFGLEEIMKQTARDYQIQAERDPRNHGLWVGSKKIGSVGLSIKKGITIHGLAMNINLDLTPFSWINPCGLENVLMTSLAQECQQSDLLVNPINMADIRQKLIQNFCRLFNFKLYKDHTKKMIHA